MKHLLQRSIATCAPTFLGTRGTQRLAVLNYHRVVSKIDFMRSSEPTVDQFTSQMDLLSRCFNPIALSEAMTLMEYGELPDKAVCVTFDDGYSDNEELALPVLEKFGIPATVFVATSFLNGGRMWNDTVIEALRIVKGETINLSEIGLGSYDISSPEKRALAAVSIIKEIKHWTPAKREQSIEVIESLELDGSMPRDLMMTDKQVEHLSDKGIDIGAHTHSHPILATLDLAQARREIFEPKALLESLIGKPVDHFAYPNGRPEVDYLVEHRDLVELAGYKSAVSTRWGVATKGTDRWQLPRFTPWDKSQLKFMVRLLLNYTKPY